MPVFAQLVLLDVFSIFFVFFRGSVTIFYTSYPKFYVSRFSERFT